jgi:hypothetical protein
MDGCGSDRVRKSFCPGRFWQFWPFCQSTLPSPHTSTRIPLHLYDTSQGVDRVAQPPSAVFRFSILGCSPRLRTSAVNLRLSDFGDDARCRRFRRSAGRRVAPLPPPIPIPDWRGVERGHPKVIPDWRVLDIRRYRLAWTWPSSEIAFGFS